jgi:hypothetical protein
MLFASVSMAVASVFVLFEFENYAKQCEQLKINYSISSANKK